MLHEKNRCGGELVPSLPPVVGLWILGLDSNSSTVLRAFSTVSASSHFPVSAAASDESNGVCGNRSSDFQLVPSAKSTSMTTIWICTDAAFRSCAFVMNAVAGKLGALPLGGVTMVA